MGSSGCANLLVAEGQGLSVIPGEDRWDQSLEAWSTVAVADSRRLWRYLVEGGRGECPRRTGRDGTTDRTGDGSAGAACRLPLPAATGRERAPSLWMKRCSTLAPACRSRRIVFYRSILQAGATAPIDALVSALAGEGIAALPVFVTSLKDAESRAFLDVCIRGNPAIRRAQYHRLRRVAGRRRQRGNSPRPRRAVLCCRWSSPGRARRRGARVRGGCCRATSP